MTDIVIQALSNIALTSISVNDPRTATSGFNLPVDRDVAMVEANQVGTNNQGLSTFDRNKFDYITNGKHAAIAIFDALLKCFNTLGRDYGAKLQFIQEIRTAEGNSPFGRIWRSMTATIESEMEDQARLMRIQAYMQLNSNVEGRRAYCKMMSMQCDYHARVSAGVYIYKIDGKEDNNTYYTYTVTHSTSDADEPPLHLEGIDVLKTSIFAGANVDEYIIVKQLSDDNTYEVLGVAATIIGALAQKGTSYRGEKQMWDALGADDDFSGTNGSLIKENGQNDLQRAALDLKLMQRIEHASQLANDPLAFDAYCTAQIASARVSETTGDNSWMVKLWKALRDSKGLAIKEQLNDEDRKDRQLELQSRG
jgi:hypothetical protein